MADATLLFDLFWFITLVRIQILRTYIIFAWGLCYRCILKMTGSLLAEELSRGGCFGLKSEEELGSKCEALTPRDNFLFADLPVDDFFMHNPNYFQVSNNPARQ